MLDAVFISDLHLHPEEELIYKRFVQFIEWAKSNTRSIYILGDFFYAWAGDDTFDEWSLSITAQLAQLAQLGIKIYFMVGNRDFLLGKKFANLAKLTLLKEPTIIKFNDEPILLMHGDSYCTDDKAHQRFRKITRNFLFTTLFLRLPEPFRQQLVHKVRRISQTNQAKPQKVMNIVVPTMLTHMQRRSVQTVIHGHIHQPGLNNYNLDGKLFKQYVLSDWDDNPVLLCYDKTKGLHFNQNVLGE